MDRLFSLCLDEVCFLEGGVGTVLGDGSHRSGRHFERYCLT